MKNFRYFCFIVLLIANSSLVANLPLFFWYTPRFFNFGDHISLKLVERIVGHKIEYTNANIPRQKFLAVGSIMARAENGDLVWGAGVSGKRLKITDYKPLSHLDIRAVRGPLSRYFLRITFNIDSPEVYGDPALLLPYFFPEFQKKENPQFDSVIIPHYTEEKLFPKDKYPNVIYPTEPWDIVIKKILNSRFVISSSLHGIIVAEAYGIPARMLRVSENEPLFKYYDYYLGTGRFTFKYASTIKEALALGGELPVICNLEALYSAFPFDYWPEAKIKDFSNVVY